MCFDQPPRIGAVLPMAEAGHVQQALVGAMTLAYLKTIGTVALS